MEPKSLVRKFLQELLARKGDAEPFSDQASLVLSGRLQSIDAVELAVFLENQFQVNFADSGFDQETIDTVDAILALVERQK